MLPFNQYLDVLIAVRIKPKESATSTDRPEYTTLAIFTNGNVHSAEETIAALNSVKEDPLSVVIVGVGPDDFSNMSFVNELNAKGERVYFVDLKSQNGKSLTEETLRRIPDQLVAYFTGKGIKPNPPVEVDEIIIEPFNEEEQSHADIVVSENGDIAVEGTVEASSQTVSPTSKIPASVASMGGKGKSMFLKQMNRQCGRVSKQMERKITRTLDQKVNKMFGIQNVSQGGRRRKPPRRKY